MYILIYGAGVLGSLYAARLPEAGQRVTILARGQRLADIRAHGLVLDDAATGRRTTTHVPAVERLAPEDRYDCVIVLVRKNQLPALAANRHTPNVLVMVNGAAGPAALCSVLGPDRVLLGFPGAGGTRVGHVVRFHLVSAFVQPTTLGEVDGRITPRLRQIAAARSAAGFPVALSTHMDAWLKMHVALVSPIANALYLAGGDAARLARAPDGLVLLVRAIREGLQVVLAHGLPITPARIRLLRWQPDPLLVAVLRRVFRTERAALVLAAHANAARDEMSCLAQEFRALADATYIPTPASARLAASLDPHTPTLAAESAALPRDWRGVVAGAALLALPLAVQLFRRAALAWRRAATAGGLGLLLDRWRQSAGGAAGWRRVAAGADHAARAGGGASAARPGTLALCTAPAPAAARRSSPLALASRAPDPARIMATGGIHALGSHVPGGQRRCEQRQGQGAPGRGEES